MAAMLIELEVLGIWGWVAWWAWLQGGGSGGDVGDRTICNLLWRCSVHELILALLLGLLCIFLRTLYHIY